MKDRIRELMEAQHMNQQTFSNCIGINTATLSGILTGRTQPTIKVVNAIMRKFPNININWLMFGQGGMIASNNPTPTSQPSSTDSGNENLFSKPHTPQATVSSFNDAPQVQPTVNRPTEPAQNNHAINSDNMAVATSFFEEPQQRQPSPNRQQNRATSQQVFPQNQPSAQPSVSIRPQIEQVDSPTPSKRRVTEIRVFYDDQTWEAFVPKKN